MGKVNTPSKNGILKASIIQLKRQKHEVLGSVYESRSVQ